MVYCLLVLLSGTALTGAGDEEVYVTAVHEGNRGNEEEKIGSEKEWKDNGILKV